MASDQLSKGAPDGTLLGQSATDKLGFYGLATAIVQPVVLAAVSTSAPISTTGATFGFASSAQAIALIAAVNTLIADLKALGLMASS